MVPDSLVLDAVTTAIAGRSILHDVSITLGSGDLIVVVGRTGSGKTTLLETAFGFRHPAAGRISVMGRPLRSYRDAIGRIGYLFPESEEMLFEQTVRDEVLVGLRARGVEREDANAQLDAALVAVDIPVDLIERDPVTLSKGERRRVAVASVLALSPRFLLFDEPFGGVDVIGRDVLVRNIDSFVGRRGGVLLATHDLAPLLGRAGRVVAIGDGTVLGHADLADHTALAGLLDTAGLPVPTLVALRAELDAAGIEIPPDAWTPEAIADAVGTVGG